MTNYSPDRDPLLLAAERSKALGHPTRLRICALLRGGPLCVCQILAVVGGAPSTLSAHLTVLRHAGIVNEARKGRWVHVRLSRDPAVESLVRAALKGAERSPRLRDDAAALEEVRTVPVEQLCSSGRETAGPAGRTRSSRTRRPSGRFS